MTTSAGPTLPPDLPLNTGERVLWASPSGGVYGHPQWLWTLGVLVFFFGGGPFFLGAMVVGAQSPLGAAIGLLGSLPAVLVVVIPVALWLAPRMRLTHFLTTERVLRRKLFGGYVATPLAGLRSVERVIVRYRSRYGEQEVITDRLRFRGAAGDFELGPSTRIDQVEDLMEHGVLTRWVDLPALPSIDGKPAPAETNDAFFVCGRTRTGADVYGPLFVGPRVAVRITEELPFHLLGRLYTRLSGLVDGTDAEVALLEILKTSAAGHFVELPRIGTKLRLDGATLTMEGEGGQRFEVTVSPEDAQRLRPQLARAVPDLPPISMSGQLPGRSAPKVASVPPPSEPVGGATSDAAPLPDLDEPAPMESAARSVALSRLSGNQRTEITAALRSDRRLLFAPARFFAEQRAVILVACVAPAITLLAFASHLGDPCSPFQDPAWIPIHALGLVPLGYVLARWTMATLAARSLPFPAGVYVLPKDLVIARGPTLRVVPLTQVAAIGAGRALPMTSHQELTFWIEGEPSEPAFVPKTEIEELVTRLEAAQKAAPQVEPAKDPLRELRRSDALEKASKARPPSSVGPALAIAAVLALLLAVPLYLVRNQLADRAALAAAGTDLDDLACYADAGGAQADTVRDVTIPHLAYEAAHAAGTVPALSDFLSAYPSSADAPTARTEREELAWSTATHDVWSLTAFIAAYPDSAHVADARGRLPALALANAREQDDVATFTNVIRTYPGTPEAEEARRLRHERYASALASITARGGEQRTLGFMRELFAYLEATDEPLVLVRFRAPGSFALQALDAALATRNGPGVEPIAYAFSTSRARGREVIVFDRLRDAFAAVAPRDVLPLDHGMRLPEWLSEDRIASRIAEESSAGASTEELEALAARLHEDNDPPSTRPEIRIDYEVVPTGDLFVLETRPIFDDPLYRAPSDLPPDRRFAGFRIDFTVQMRLPAPEGAVPSEPVTLRFSVTPPESMALGTPMERGTVEVYDLLATAAFDRLSEELSRAFFGAE